MNNMNFKSNQIKTEKKPFTGYEAYIFAIVLILFSAIGLSKKTLPFTKINLHQILTNLVGFWAPFIFLFIGYLGIMGLFRRKVHSFLATKLSSLVVFILSITIIFYQKAGKFGLYFGTKLNTIMFRPLWFIVSIFLLLVSISLFVYHTPFTLIQKIILFIQAIKNPNKISVKKEVDEIKSVVMPQQRIKQEATFETTSAKPTTPIVGTAREVNNIIDLISPRNESKKTTLNTPNSNMNNSTPRVRQTPYVLPSKELLNVSADNTKDLKNKDHANTLVDPLVQVLSNFGIPAEVVNITVGPSVTRFELKLLDHGLKVSKVLSLEDNIKMNLSAKSIRIQAPIPGKALIGIEVPNRYPALVGFKEVVASQPRQQAKNPLSCALGKDIEGKPAFIELNKTPHMLVAGATGSGKSVCINTILASIILHASPQEVRLLLVDPKMVEFTQFTGIPHLLAPIITNPKKAAFALAKAVEDMESRYKLLASVGARKIEDYNDKVPKKDKLPYIVIIIDELADLMMVASKEVEISIARITQKARAAGIHLILATQRPSTDVVTGLIKANIPTRISFAVSSSIDSRTILDSSGAQNLLGRGDMLLRNQGGMILERIQGAFIGDEELDKIINDAKAQREPEYEDLYVNIEVTRSAMNGKMGISDDLYDDVKRFVIESQKASSSLLQRRFAIGYGRAARLLDSLEEQGIVGPARGSKPREVLIK